LNRETKIFTNIHWSSTFVLGVSDEACFYRSFSFKTHVDPSGVSHYRIGGSFLAHEEKATRATRSLMAGHQPRLVFYNMAGWNIFEIGSKLKLCDGLLESC
jgi:hypothetical protein